MDAATPWCLRGSRVPALPAPSECLCECMADVGGLATPCGSQRVLSLSHPLQPLALAGAAGRGSGDQPPPAVLRGGPAGSGGSPQSPRHAGRAGARGLALSLAGRAAGAGLASVRGMEDSLPCLAAACDPSVLVNFCTGKVPPPAPRGEGPHRHAPPARRAARL